MPTPAPTFRSGVSRHEQLSDWLRDRIRAGEYVAHDQLPSEAELGELSGVSRITVRRALATLENEGRIYRRQGLGSFAAPPALPQGLVRLTDFAQDMERAGLSASSRVLHQAPEAASPTVVVPGSTASASATAPPWPSTARGCRRSTRSSWRVTT